MGSGKNFIYVRGLRLPLGQHKIALPGYKKATLTIAKKEGKPVCRLDTKTRSGQRQTMVDRGCDGVDTIEVKKGKQSRKLGKGPKSKDKYIEADKTMLAALRKVVPGFLFSDSEEMVRSRRAQRPSEKYVKSKPEEDSRYVKNLPPGLVYRVIERLANYSRQTAFYKEGDAVYKLFIADGLLNLRKVGDENSRIPDNKVHEILIKFLHSLYRNDVVAEYKKPPATQPPKRRGKRQKTSGRYEVYFKTGDHTLGTDSKRTLERIVESYKGGEIIIEGHCDYRGTEKYNYGLGQNRATSTRDYLLEAFTKKGLRPTMSLISYGESRPTGKSLASDRRARIIFNRHIIEEGLDSTNADAYLIDASGSMQEEWSIVTSYEFPINAKVFSFNDSGLHNDLLVKPDGGTPLWLNAYRMIEKMKKYEELVILSDGENTSYYEYYHKVKDAAQKKVIRITTVFVGSSKNTKEHIRKLLHLSKATNGSHYIRFVD